MTLMMEKTENEAILTILDPLVDPVMLGVQVVPVEPPDHQVELRLV